MSDFTPAQRKLIEQLKQPGYYVTDFMGRRHLFNANGVVRPVRDSMFSALVGAGLLVRAKHRDRGFSRAWLLKKSQD